MMKTMNRPDSVDKWMYVKLTIGVLIVSTVLLGSRQALQRHHRALPSITSSFDPTDFDTVEEMRANTCEEGEEITIYKMINFLLEWGNTDERQARISMEVSRFSAADPAVIAAKKRDELITFFKNTLLAGYFASDEKKSISRSQASAEDVSKELDSYASAEYGGKRLGASCTKAATSLVNIYFDKSEEHIFNVSRGGDLVGSWRRALEFYQANMGKTVWIVHNIHKTFQVHNGGEIPITKHDFSVNDLSGIYGDANSNRHSQQRFMPMPKTNYPAIYMEGSDTQKVFARQDGVDEITEFATARYRSKNWLSICGQKEWCCTDAAGDLDDQFILKKYTVPDLFKKI